VLIGRQRVSQSDHFATRGSASVCRPEDRQRELEAATEYLSRRAVPSDDSSDGVAGDRGGRQGSVNWRKMTKKRMGNPRIVSV
jgi:hypothetical protein